MTFTGFHKNILFILVFAFHSLFFIVSANGPLSHVEYSTFVGGTGNEHNGGMYKGGMVADDDGNIYILGMTNSQDFPTTSGVLQEVYGGSSYDCVISKFDPTLTNLLAATYIGGSGDDRCADIEIGPKGSVYVSLNTTSSNLPTNTNSYDSIRNGRDTYIARINPDLTQVLESTYFGGTSNELYATDMEFASDGTLYFASSTASTNLPLAGTPYQGTRAGSYDIFVAHMDAALTTLIDSTYLGGTSVELYNTTITIDNNNDIVVRGHTASSNFPVTAGAYQVSNAGSYDITLSRLDPTLTALKHSTYIGGSSADYYSYYGGQVVFDADNNPFLIGSTASNDFPVTAGTYDTVYAGGREAFILSLNQDFSVLTASTFIGGSSSEMGSSLEFLTSGDLVFLGATPSAITPGPTIDAYDSTRSGWDNMLGIISPDLIDMKQFTYVGGTNGSDYNYETDESLIIDGECVYFTSSSSSNNNTFPVHTGSGELPYQSNSSGSRDQTITKMCPASCGDNVVQEFEGEECDDENTVTGDGCSATCKIERCGDGLILGAEECDDNNDVSGDGCSDVCEVEYCRDDAPITDTSKSFDITEFSPGVISGTSSQSNSKVAICMEDTTGSRDIFYTTTDTSGAFTYTPNLSPYSSDWVSVGVMLHDENNADIDHHSLILKK